MSQSNSSFEEDEQEGARAPEGEWQRQQADTDRLEVLKSKRIFEEAEAYAATQREANKKKSAAERSFTEAAEFSRNQIKSDGLDGEVRPYCEVRYTVAQGLKAAVHGREDGIATLVLQRDILVRLDSIKALLWIVATLLAFIAYEVA